jgi:uncharacterized LabA/DUF88 family protein
MRANVYIDAFNLYYGCIKDTPFRWLDLRLLSEKLLRGHQVHRVRYFTARIQGRPTDPQAPQRQQAYVRALETIPGLTVHYGRFLSKTIRMPLSTPPRRGPRTVEVLKTEEKGSDVNLATYLLLDAFDGDCEMALVVSNDSDLVEPIRMVRAKFGLPVGVVNPQRTTSQALRQAASFYRPLRQGVLGASQLPTQLPDANGIITKPAAW